MQGIKDSLVKLKPKKTQWGYSAEIGPEKWGDLNKSWHACKTGKQQSPVDIKNTKSQKLETLKFDYKDSPLVVINTGSTVELKLPKTNTLTIGDSSYHLLQLHFHTPSEHTRLGKKRPMEVHFVHKNDEGQLAVVAVFMRYGKSNALFDTILKNAPKSKGKNKVKGVTINPKDLHAANMKVYFNYTGSLTTPPCSEGVRWFVMKNSVRVSKAQVKAFKEFYNGNARPVQAINGRTISESK